MLAPELVERHLPARESVAGRDDEDHLIAEEGLEDDPAVARRGADDAELELAFGHLLDHPIRVRNRQRDTQLRVRALELAEQHRDDRATRPGRGAERKLATQHVAVSCELVEQLPLEREHALRGPVEALPRLSRLDPSPRAVEQLRPKPLLERANLKADGRLGHPEPLGGLREALAVDDFAEGGKLTRIHKRSL